MLWIDDDDGLEREEGGEEVKSASGAAPPEPAGGAASGDLQGLTAPPPSGRGSGSGGGARAHLLRAVAARGGLLRLLDVGFGCLARVCGGPLYLALAAASPHGFATRDGAARHGRPDAHGRTPLPAMPAYF